MASNVSREAGSAFRIRRPVITSSGFFSDTDPTVASLLDELNRLLEKRIFDHSAAAGGAAVKKAKGLDPAVVLSAELTPKRTPGDPTWKSGSLADQLDAATENDSKITLSEYINKTANLSELNYGFDELLLNTWPTLQYNSKAILREGYDGLRDYLVAVAYLFKGITELKGLKNFAFSTPSGVARIVDYASVSAAREIVKKKALDVDRFNSDKLQIVKDIEAAKLTLSAAAFTPALLKIVDEYIFESKYERLLNNATGKGTTIGEIPTEIKPQLVDLIRLSPVEITSANIDYFLPQWISDLTGGTAIVQDRAPSTPEQSERDFDVEFFEDDDSMVIVSKAAVKCAAQLYYSMVAGDNLGIFETVNYFTHKYLIRGGVEVTDRRLRDDLQNYVFSNRFTDLKTGELVDRTRAAERQMFYRQVFAAQGPDVEDSIVNEDFPHHWKILMLESADYLERAQDSPNPDSFVSRQKVMQAVEDLQYNLSTHCTGMANVITPLIYAELNFVIKRIFMHQEVLRQVVPVGSTWWRVVEKLYAELKHSRPKATVLYNKAKLGHDIIASVADYNPSTFEEDAEFGEFISKVDAFITTQSILQEALTDDLRRDHQEEESDYHEPPTAAAPVPVTTPSGSNGKGPSDEWDF